MIEDAAAWMMRRADYHGPDGRIGMMGISFGGGLTLVAAGRPSIAEQRGVRHVVRRPRRSAADAALSLYRRPAGRRRPSAARLRPRDRPAGVADRSCRRRRCSRCATRSSPFSKRRGSTWSTRSRPPRSSPAPRRSRRRSREPAHTYMGYVNARDVARLGPVLLPDARRARRRSRALAVALAAAAVPGLSAARHRRQRRARRSSRRCWRRTSRPAGLRVQLLETPLITHAEVDRRSTPACDLAVDTLLDERCSMSKSRCPTRAATEARPAGRAGAAPEDPLRRGVASRRLSEELIVQGRVTVNGVDRDRARHESRSRRATTSGSTAGAFSRAAPPLHPAEQAARLRHDPRSDPQGRPTVLDLCTACTSTSIRSAASTTTRKDCCCSPTTASWRRG